VGVNENAVVDNISTKVKLYINDETFFSGRITNESPFFLVFMKDESDINTGGGMSWCCFGFRWGCKLSIYIKW